jgi:hypothetical protein
MFAFPDSCFTKRKMMISWSNNIGRIDLSQKLPGSLNLFNPYLQLPLPHFSHPDHKSRQVRILNFFPVIQVKFTKMTNAKNSNLEHVIHLMLKDKDWRF